MSAALIIIVVVALLVGGIMALRSSAKTGMPSKEVLDRAVGRARELKADEETHEDSKRDG